MQEFLNPKSMLTPGVAGGVVMMVATVLYVQFDLPAKFTALGMCFVICLFVFSSAAGAAVVKIPMPFKLILYLLNSLVMFAVAMGTHAPLQAAKPGKVAPPTNQVGSASGQTSEWSIPIRKEDVTAARKALEGVGTAVEDLRVKVLAVSAGASAVTVSRSEVEKLEQQLTFAVSRFNDQKFLLERMEREVGLQRDSDELIRLEPKAKRSFTDPWI